MSIDHSVEESDEELRKRLDELRRRLFKGNNAAMARASKVDPSTLHRVLSGDTRRVSAFIIESVIENIDYRGQHVRRAWLEQGVGPMLAGGAPSPGAPGCHNGTGAERGDAVEEVHLDVTVETEKGEATVKPIPVARFLIDFVALSALRERRPERPFLTRVVGNSMETEFSCGDQIVVEPYLKEEGHTLSDGIYVIRLDGEFQIKQVEYRPKQCVVCKPLNPQYDGFEIDLADEQVDFEVIGRVRGKFERY